MGWGDIFSGAGQAGGMGALAGSPFGVPGAVIGGGLGALYGGYQGYKRGQAKDEKAKAMQASRQQLADLQTSQYAQRQADIDRALSFFGPTDALMKQMYGGKKR